MNDTLLKLYVKMQTLMMREDGQDLVEYALVLAVISIGSIAILGTLSAKVVSVFTAVQTAI